MKKLLFLLALAFVLGSAGACATQLEDTVWSKNFYPRTCKNAVFSPNDSSIYVTAGDTTFKLATATGAILQQWTPEQMGKGIKKFTQDGNYFLTYNGTKRNAITLDSVMKYNLITSNLTNDFDCDSSCSIVVADLITGLNDSSHILIMNGSTGELIRTIYDSLGCVNKIAVSPDGNYIATIDIKVIVTSPGNYHQYYKLNLWNANTGELITTLVNQEGTELSACKFSPDNRYLSVSKSGRIKLYDINSLLLYRTYIEDGIVAIAFSSDSHFFASGGGSSDAFIWDIDNNELSYQYHFTNVIGTTLNFSKDTKYIVGCISYINMLLNVKTFNKVSENSDNENAMVIYPNPTDGIITIRNNFFSTKINYKIINQNGDILNQMNNQIVNNGLKIDFSSYPSGIYFIQINCNNSLLTYKVVKEN